MITKVMINLINKKEGFSHSNGYAHVDLLQCYESHAR